jgi:CDP-diacylglycerol--serine O-phosphatidyltransferase
VNIKATIPNGITLFNLLFGVAALVEDDINWAFYFILFAALADFLDGFVARLLNVSSELGKQLDSLADLVSFGVVPSVFLFRLLQPEWGNIAFLTFGLSAAAAFRLARFNIDPSQAKGFKGLPMPANGLFWMSVIYVHQNQPLPSLALLLLSVVFTFLMASRLPLIALKFDHYKLQGNVSRYSLILGVVGSIVYASLALKNFVYGFPIALILYIIISFIDYSIKKNEQIQSRN